eukprot:CAMPEP_0198679474 /NCGR_PEP_ID=MMETSP1468-20131203/2773_1 /TAXON_ID=1461545 /ORGANISM="Mantoniella sp, Strain CCMP1436" /LENGTH=59 /DNA_ID=CAMNT_0044418201 /DNA_START=1600 /DNA_END=1779 /DNA_ORIENTATION=-
MPRTSSPPTVAVAATEVSASDLALANVAESSPVRRSTSCCELRPVLPTLFGSDTIPTFE